MSVMTENGLVSYERGNEPVPYGTLRRLTFNSFAASGCDNFASFDARSVLSPCRIVASFAAIIARWLSVRCRRFKAMGV